MSYFQKSAKLTLHKGLNPCGDSLSPGFSTFVRATISSSQGNSPYLLIFSKFAIGLLLWICSANDVRLL